MKLKQLIILASILSSIFFLTSCYRDNEETLYPQISKPCDTSGATYAAKVKPILDANCNSCHGASAAGGLDLRSYDVVKANITTISGCIDNSNGPLMPPGAKMQDCKITLIKNWQKAGALNN